MYDRSDCFYNRGPIDHHPLSMETWKH
jgi:hypothetical protein